MAIRARVYRNKKQTARVQITMDLEEAKAVLAGKDEGEFKKQLTEAVKGEK